MNGRAACPDCGGRDTERVSSTTRRARTECHSCGNEWDEYHGPDCPNCDSNNTRERTIRYNLTQKGSEIVCYDCDFNRRLTP